MRRIALKMRRWRPGEIPDVLSACGAERLPDKVLPELRVVRAIVPIGIDVETVRLALAAHPDVEWAYVEEEIHFTDAYHAAPNDPRHETDPTLSWWFSRIGMYHGWKRSTGGASTLLVIVDTGTLPHEDLPTIPADRQWNAALNVADASERLLSSDPSYGHGARVLGLVAAKRNNGLGWSGISPDVSLGFVALTTETAWGTTLDVAEGFTKAVEWGLDLGARVVINASWITYSNGFGLQPIIDAVNYAWSNGAIIFASAGNDNYSLDAPTYYAVPAELSNVVCVGATDSLDRQAVWSPSAKSNYGSAVDLLAPGDDTGSIDRTSYSGYYWMGGTSGSSPIAAAIGANLLSLAPSLTNQEIVDTLRGTAEPSLDSALFPNAGIVHYGHAANKIAALASPGSIVPDLAFAGPGATGKWDLVSVSGGVARTTLAGRCTIEASAFSTKSITRVVLKHNGATVYDGPRATLTVDATFDGVSALPVSYEAFAFDGTSSGDVEFADVVSTSLVLVEAEVAYAIPHTIRVEAGGDPVYATLSPGADAPVMAGDGSLNVPGLSADPGLPACAGRGSLTAPGFAASPSLPSMQGAGALSTVEILAYNLGHRIRAVAGGAPVIVNVVPGADLDTMAGLGGAGAVSIGAQVPLAALVGAGAMAAPGLGLSLAAMAGTGALSLSASAAPSLPAMAGAGAMLAPSAQEENRNPEVPAMQGAGSLAEPGIGLDLPAMSGAGAVSLEVSAAVPLPSMRGAGAMRVISSGAGTTDRQVDIDAHRVVVGIMAKPVHGAIARGIRVGIRAKRGTT